MIRSLVKRSFKRSFYKLREIACLINNVIGKSEELKKFFNMRVLFNEMKGGL